MNDGDTEAGCDARAFRQVQVVASIHKPLDAFGENLTSVCVAVFKNDGELLAANSATNSRVRCKVIDDPAKISNHLIPRRVAETVIDRLEVIEVG